MDGQQVSAVLERAIWFVGSMSYNKVPKVPTYLSRFSRVLETLSALAHQSV